MDLPEETPKSEEPVHPEETFPEESVLPDDFTPIDELSRPPRSRRRRGQHLLAFPGEDERAMLLDTLARRAVPSFEFFLFAFLCGIALGAGYLLDLKINSLALLLLGVLLAPAMTPWVGMTLAAITGSWRFFFLTLGGLIVAGLLVFLTGSLAGLAGHLWLPLPAVFQADTRSHLWWLDLFIVALGAVLLVISFVHSEQKPFLSSALLAYGLFLPLSAAGFELGIHASLPWSNGLLVFLVHLTLATLLGGIVLAVLHFKPATAKGHILPIVVCLLSLASLFIFTGMTMLIRNGITAARRIEPTPTLPSPPSPSPTPFPTLTRVATQLPSSTFSPTATLEPTPAYAVVNASSFGGANLRTEPAAGQTLATISNGLIVQVLPEIRNVGTANWVHVRWSNMDGWILQSVLKVSDLTPTAVPSITVTPTP